MGHTVVVHPEGLHAVFVQSAAEHMPIVHPAIVHPARGTCPSMSVYLHSQMYGVGTVRLLHLPS